MPTLGWKTILGAALYASGAALPAAWPELSQMGPYLTAAGAVLGGVGVAHKGAKVLDALKILTDGRAAPSREG